MLKPIGRFKAKQKLSELVNRASEEEQIGIRRVASPAAVPRTYATATQCEGSIRRRRGTPEGNDVVKKVFIKELIEEARV